MISKAHPISRAALAAHVYLLCCELVLWACVWTALLWLDGEGSLDLRCLWAFRIISWAVLYSLTTHIADKSVQPLLKRWVALQSFLPAVFDSVAQPLLQEIVRGFSPMPDPGMVILSSVTSSLIYLVWEVAFPHGGSAKGARIQEDEEAKTLLMRVIRYSRPDYLHLGAAFVFLSLAALFETFIPYCVGKVVDILSGKYQHENFLWATGLMALCSLGSSVFTGLRGGMFMCSLSRLNMRIRHMLFQNLMKQEINFFEENKPGSLTSRLISDTDKMGRSVAMNVNVLLRSLVKTCGMLFFMLRLSWQLTLLTCIEMPLLAFIQNSYNNLSQFITVGLKVEMLFQGRNLISSGQLSIGSLLAFVFYQKDMVTNMRHLVYIYGDMLNTVGSAVKVFQLLDRKSQMKEMGNLAPKKLEGKLTFEKVTFSYHSRPDEKALKSVTLELSPGKVTALIGPSGGGKSSCVCLMQRFYEPQEGEVFLDGVPLYRYQHQYLHQKVVMVSQKPVLFSGSVRHNIEYGLQDCTIERVEEAARKANAHDFICMLEQGYDTDVGECGDQLSAGQKQCIAIARALIRNPQILILDEATSDTDYSAQAVQDLLNKTDQTVLVIAHRLETVEKADHIIFMEEGKVVEQGTHQQLMAKEGRYYRIKEKLFTEPTNY
ncbi:antigen peptide transporter 2-like isoform X2 [Myxocyprinus asiaticus]|uniref:antigen peptide transporter 2-like isoform X2 n=1 Tax=Myxocyprinus asiaticus TaxID=70543 RepID=UPI0022216B62|nr:antigen peptide transporter 2-like isoform X2 [Myxocyprinus asiaticus]